MFWKQLGLMKDSVKDGTKVANAASAQANSLKAAERAYVKLAHTEAPHIDQKKNWGAVRMEIKNYGRTPATVTDAVFGANLLDIAASLEIPPPYPANDVREAIPHAFLVTQDFFYTSKTFPLVERDREAILCGEKRLWIFGYVDYIDAFNERYRGEWVRVYNPLLDDGEQNTLVYPNIGRYNSDRKRKNGEGNDW